MVSILTKIGKLLDVPSSSKNSKGLASGFKMNFGGICRKSKREVLNSYNNGYLNYQNSDSDIHGLASIISLSVVTKYVVSRVILPQSVVSY